jgi:hypothetical protein
MTGDILQDSSKIYEASEATFCSAAVSFCPQGAIKLACTAMALEVSM